MVDMKQICHKTSSEKAILQLIDIENLCGGSIQVGKFHREVRATVASYSKLKALLTVVAAGPTALQSCPDLLWDWSSNRFLIGHGVDGADRRLLDVLVEPQLRRVYRVEIWSGDHCFASAARSLTRQGIAVHVFSRRDALANCLKEAASEVTILSELAFLDADQFARAS
jgi:hypothetical protein